MGERGERCTPAFKLTMRTGELRAQRLRHPRAAIVRRATADADDKVLASVVQSCQYQFTHAIRCRNERIALLYRNKGQARTGGHLNHRRMTITQNAIERFHRLP